MSTIKNNFAAKLGYCSFDGDFICLEAESSAKEVISGLPARLEHYEQDLAAEQARGITQDNMKRVKRLEDLIENTKRSIRMYNGR